MTHQIKQTSKKEEKCLLFCQLALASEANVHEVWARLAANVAEKERVGVEERATIANPLASRALALARPPKLTHGTRLVVNGVDKGAILALPRRLLRFSFVGVTLLVLGPRRNVKDSRQLLQSHNICKHKMYLFF